MRTMVWWMLLAAPLAAQAGTWSGNPIVSFEVTMPGGGAFASATVDIDRVEVGYCSGAVHTTTFGTTEDVSDWISVMVPGGDLCDVTVYWDSDIAVVGTNGLGPFTGDIGDPTSTSLIVVWNPQVHEVSDFTLTSGSWGSAPNPEFRVKVTGGS
ncbi:MAG: hypothetical protein AAF211_20630 [Myxococcota bacterium]